jgi:hypothetical protein
MHAFFFISRLLQACCISSKLAAISTHDSRAELLAARMPAVSHGCKAETCHVTCFSRASKALIVNQRLAGTHSCRAAVHNCWHSQCQQFCTAARLKHVM